MPEDTNNTPSTDSTPAAVAESLGEPKPAAAEGSSEAKPDVAEGSVEAKPTEEPPSTSSPPSRSEPLQTESSSIPPVEPPSTSSGQATPSKPEPTLEPTPASQSEPLPEPPIPGEPLPVSPPIQSSPDPSPSESDLLAAEIAQRKSLKPSKRFMRWLSLKGLAARRLLTRKRLEKLMSPFDQHDKLTRAQVEKMLRVSLHTADSDLDLLEKEGKIKQVGTRGWGVFYTKV